MAPEKMSIIYLHFFACHCPHDVPTALQQSLSAAGGLQEPSGYVHSPFSTLQYGIPMWGKPRAYVLVHKRLAMQCH